MMETWDQETPRFLVTEIPRFLVTEIPRFLVTENQIFLVTEIHINSPLEAKTWELNL